MPRQSSPEPGFDELQIYQIALAVIGVASLAAGRNLTALASFLLMAALAFLGHVYK
jgi:hypothetical protein